MLEASAPLNLWIFAKDLERSRRFYGETLGLPLWREEPGTALHFGAGGSLLSIRATSVPRERPHGMFVLFAVGRGIDQVCSELVDRGVALEEPLADREFGRSAMVRDPDGYEIWLCRPSATETQFLRLRFADRSKGRRIPVNRRPNPRRHERPPPTRRSRHPDT